MSEMSKQSEKVPQAMAETFAAVTAITDAFCREHLSNNPPAKPGALEIREPLKAAKRGR